MVNLSTKWGIPLFDDTDVFDPIQTPMGLISTATETALDKLYAKGLPIVSGQAARNLLYPAAKQGDGVYRSDVGYEERYFGAYNSSTNPAGAKSAGWYPLTPGAIAGRLSRSTVPVQIGITHTGLNDSSWWILKQARNISPFTTGWTIPLEGRYRIDVALSVDVQSCFTGVTVNTTTYTVDTFVTQASGPAIFNTGMAQTSKEVDLSAGDVVRMSGLYSATSTQWPTSAERSWFNITYIGVRQQ